VATANARVSMLTMAWVHCERGALEPAPALLTTNDALSDSANPQTKSFYASAEARLLRGEARHAEAVVAAERGLELRGELSVTDEGVKFALVEAMEAALALGDLDKAEALLAIPESLDPGELTPLLQANSAPCGLVSTPPAATTTEWKSTFAARPSSSASSGCGFTSRSASSNTPNGSSPRVGATRRSRCWPRRARPSSGSRQLPGSRGWRGLSPPSASPSRDLLAQAVTVRGRLGSKLAPWTSSSLHPTLAASPSPMTRSRRSSA
jgi:hypothetical protein